MNKYDLCFWWIGYSVCFSVSLLIFASYILGMVLAFIRGYLVIDTFKKVHEILFWLSGITGKEFWDIKELLKDRDFKKIGISKVTELYEILEKLKYKIQERMMK